MLNKWGKSISSGWILHVGTLIRDSMHNFKQLKVVLIYLVCWLKPWFKASTSWRWQYDTPGISPYLEKKLHCQM